MNENAKKYCPGLAHLRKALRLAVQHNPQETKITVDDSEDSETFGTTEPEIERAAAYATEIDDILQYSIGTWVIQVVYDGPYDETNAAEIINDTNGAADRYLSELSL